MNQSNRFNHRPTPFQFIEQSMELVGRHLRKRLVLDSANLDRIFGATNEATEAERGTNPVGGVASRDQYGFIDEFGADG